MRSTLCPSIPLDIRQISSILGFSGYQHRVGKYHTLLLASYSGSERSYEAHLNGY